MAVELTQLLFAVLLAFGHLVVYGVVANLELGVGYTAGPRDEPPTGLSMRAQRIGRAFSNYLETLPWFAIAVIVAHLGQRIDDVVITCGWVYLVARVLYLPIYVIDIPYTRSAVWAVATGAILTIVIRTLF